MFGTDEAQLARLKAVQEGKLIRVMLPGGSIINVPPGTRRYWLEMDQKVVIMSWNEIETLPPKLVPKVERIVPVPDLADVPTQALLDELKNRAEP